MANQQLMSSVVTPQKIATTRKANAKRLKLDDDVDRDGVLDKNDYGGGAGLGDSSYGPMLGHSSLLGYAGEIVSHKHHRFKSYAYARTLIMDATDTNKIYLTSPLMEVPWDKLLMYLKQGELGRLTAILLG